MASKRPCIVLKDENCVCSNNNIPGNNKRSGSTIATSQYIIRRAPQKKSSFESQSFPPFSHPEPFLRPKQGCILFTISCCSSLLCRVFLLDLQVVAIFYFGRSILVILTVVGPNCPQRLGTKHFALLLFWFLCHSTISYAEIKQNSLCEKRYVGLGDL